MTVYYFSNKVFINIIIIIIIIIILSRLFLDLM